MIIGSVRSESVQPCSYAVPHASKHHTQLVQQPHDPLKARVVSLLTNDSNFRPQNARKPAESLFAGTCSAYSDSDSVKGPYQSIAAFQPCYQVMNGSQPEAYNAAARSTISNSQSDVSTAHEVAWWKNRNRTQQLISTANYSDSTGTYIPFTQTNANTDCYTPTTTRQSSLQVINGNQVSMSGPTQPSTSIYQQYGNMRRQLPLWNAGNAQQYLSASNTSAQMINNNCFEHTNPSHSYCESSATGLISFQAKSGTKPEASIPIESAASNIGTVATTNKLPWSDNSDSQQYLWTRNEFIGNNTFTQAESNQNYNETAGTMPPFYSTIDQGESNQPLHYTTAFQHHFTTDHHRSQSNNVTTAMQQEVAMPSEPTSIGNHHNNLHAVSSQPSLSLVSYDQHDSNNSNIEYSSNADVEDDPYNDDWLKLLLTS